MQNVPRMSQLANCHLWCIRSIAYSYDGLFRRNTVSILVYERKMQPKSWTSTIEISMVHNPTGRSARWTSDKNYNSTTRATFALVSIMQPAQPIWRMRRKSSRMAPARYPIGAFGPSHADAVAALVDIVFGAFELHLYLLNSVDNRLYSRYLQRCTRRAAFYFVRVDVIFGN